MSILSTNTPLPPPADPSNREWKAEEVGFFNPGLDDPDNVPIITIGRHSFYRDVYSYVDRLKDLVKQRSPNKLRTILPECFRGNAQIWYSVELGEMEKDLLRSVLIEKWYNVLIKKFKTRILRVLRNFIEQIDV